ncbi:MAG: TIGR04283 family arsenosugar biosynthesis glycosyltransferase [Acidobacteria bacterium]|nr:TIGR04283 family arsenosugar biosynthesis glycosyltransferase [Acidobacteriota bacterium]
MTVISPVLGDADALRALLRQLPTTPDLDIVVVDGGAEPQIEALVGSHGRATLRRSSPGRARQMNAGAAGATSEWLLFLHADSTLPPGWLAAIMSLGDDAAGGWFRFALEDPAWQARVIERLVAWRVRHLRLPYGDQGLLVRRRIFEQLGGYRDMPLMEDVEFVRRLVRAGPMVELPLSLGTSARRWRRDGWWRRSLKNLTILALYHVGVSPARLALWYQGPPRA